MVDPKFLSSYQNPEGTLSDRLAPRTDMRKGLFDWGTVTERTVLDIGCNNGWFVREALRKGARRAVGVDKSDAIIGARELAKEEGLPAEFWQMDVESKEFKRHCPRFETVFLLSVLTHMRDREGFLDWLDDRIIWCLVFESNHGEKNKEHIELVQKHINFASVTFLGRSDIPGKPHYLWVCKKWNHAIRYPTLLSHEIEFIPIDKIYGWDEKSIMNQRGAYQVDSDRFKALLEDIRQRGIREPLILQDEHYGYFRGFQGSHRYLAAKILGYKDVPCRVLRGEFVKHLNK